MIAHFKEDLRTGVLGQYSIPGLSHLRSQRGNWGGRPPPQKKKGHQKKRNKEKKERKKRKKKCVGKKRKR